MYRLWLNRDEEEEDDEVIEFDFEKMTPEQIDQFTDAHGLVRDVSSEEIEAAL